GMIQSAGLPAPMRVVICVICSLLGAAAPVLAQEPPASAVAPVPPDEALADPNAIRRQALFDLALEALVDGNLPLAERAFGEAASLPGDVAQSAVAETFAE